MKRSVWAALVTAGALAIAGQAGAAVVYYEAGTIADQICAPGGGCLGGSFHVGGIGPIPLTHTNSDLQGPGSYHWELDLNPSLLTHLLITPIAWDSYDEFLNGGFIGGNDTPIPVNGSYQVTAKGIVGDFTVGPPTEFNGFASFGGPLLPYRRVDHFFTGVTIDAHAILGSAGTPYVFTITSVPEPGTWTLMFTGFFGLGLALRRRRRAAAAASSTD